MSQETQQYSVPKTVRSPGVFRRIGCDACHKDITHKLTITCVTCSLDPSSIHSSSSSSSSSLADSQTSAVNEGASSRASDDSDRMIRVHICGECFVKRAPLDASPAATKEKRILAKMHDYSHPYRVNDNLQSMHPCSPSWTAEEELKLLEGIELYGFGNWKEISGHVGPTKTLFACAEHFMDTYVHSLDNKPKPQMTAETKEIERNKIKTFIERASTLRHAQGSELSGYQTFRQDFDVEYLNDAEVIISEITFDANEVRCVSTMGANNAMNYLASTNTQPVFLRNIPAFASDPIDSNLKLKIKMLMNYNKKLDARNKRKKFLLENGMLDMKLLTEKKRPKEEKDIATKLQPFAKYRASQKDHEQFVANTIQEKRIRQEIKRLQEYRARGCRFLSEMDQMNDESSSSAEKSTISASEYNLFKDIKIGSSISEPLTELNSDKMEIAIDSSNVRSSLASETSISSNNLNSLSPVEKEICRQLDLSSEQFLKIRTRMIEEILRQRFLNSNDVTRSLRLDMRTTDTGIDIYVSLGGKRISPFEPQPQQNQIQQQQQSMAKQSESSSIIKSSNRHSIAPSTTASSISISESNGHQFHNAHLSNLPTSATGSNAMMEIANNSSNQDNASNNTMNADTGVNTTINDGYDMNQTSFTPFQFFMRHSFEEFGGSNQNQ